MERTGRQTKAAAGRQARALIPVSEQGRLSLEELAQAILDRRLRPGAAQLRLLAEAVLATKSASQSPAKDEVRKEKKKGSGRARKAKKTGKKKGKNPKGRVRT